MVLEGAPDRNAVYHHHQGWGLKEKQSLGLSSLNPYPVAWRFLTGERSCCECFQSRDRRCLKIAGRQSPMLT